VADALTLDTWSEDGTKLARVLGALADMRRSSAQHATRASVLTLVIVIRDEEDALRANRATNGLGARHPARIVILRMKPGEAADARGDIDASLTLVGTGSQDHPVVYEEVRLALRGAVVEHLDSVVEPMALPDLPLVVWYPGRLPPPGSALPALADTVIVDSREAGGEQSLAALSELSKYRPTGDLSWVRLSPWRALLASLFESVASRRFAYGVTELDVEGKPAPRLLLAGWLCSTLGVGKDVLTLRDDRHASVRIRAELGGRVARFEVTRGPGDRIVRASSMITDGPSYSELLPLPDDSLAWSLGQALTHLERDRVWERALHAAASLVPAGVAGGRAPYADRRER
jgi:glucose-6-phosphate dehydrogenase assembly protein OpcA